MTDCFRFSTEPEDRGSPDGRLPYASRRRSRRYECTNPHCRNVGFQVSVKPETVGAFQLWPNITCIGCGCEPMLIDPP